MIYALLMRTTPPSRTGKAGLARSFRFQQCLSLTRFRITHLGQRPLQEGIEIFHSVGEPFRWKSAEHEHRWRRYQEAHHAEGGLHILGIHQHPQHLSCFPHGYLRGEILLICVSSNQCFYHPRPLPATVSSVRSTAAC